MRFYLPLRMSGLRFRLSGAIEQTSKPPIPQAYAWAENYKPTPTRPLLDMSQGVPGVPPPPLFLSALGQASSSPTSCGYVPNVGEPSLRTAIAEEMRIPYGKDIDVTKEDIAITAGCNMAFAATAMTIAEKGDEVILPVPWYFNHEMTLTMLGVTPIPLGTDPENGFLPSTTECEKLITPRTKAIVLVTPNNPTGAIYPASLIASFAQLARAHNLALILDETYRDFLSPSCLPPHHLFSSPFLTPPTSFSLPSDWSWRSTVIHLFSFSKSYCIPGHRLGLICASPDFIPSLNKALDNAQICAPRPPQIALSTLIPSLRPFVQSNNEALAHRHTLFKSLLPPKWKIGAQGGYYAFVKHPFVEKGATEVAKRLAEEIGVVCLPAGFFGPKTGIEASGIDNEKHEHIEDRWIRFSVANVDDDKVRHVCERLKESETAFGWKVGRS